MSSIPYFKIGDTFSVPIRFYDTETDDGVEITPLMNISCRIQTKAGELISDCVVTPYPDQINDKGYVLLTVADTTSWRVGEAQADVKLQILTEIRHSASFCFKIVKSITP